MKPRTRNAIILSCVIVLLIAGLVVVLNLETSQKIADQTSRPVAEEAITLQDNKRNDIAKMVIKNKNESIIFDASDNDIGFTIESLDGIALSKNDVSFAISDGAKIVASRIIAKNPEDPSAFGLADPEATIEVTLKDNTSYKVNIGTSGPGGVRYFSMNDDKTIYLASTDFSSSAFSSTTKFVNTSLVSLASGDSTDNLMINSFEFGGTIRPNKLKIDYKASESNSTALSSFVINSLSPAKDADTYKMSKIIKQCVPLAADKAVDFKCSDSKLEEYGLKNPYSTMTFLYDDQTQTIKLGNKQDKSYYMMINDRPVVYLISEDKVNSWAEFTPNDFVTDQHYLRMISEVDSVEATFGSNTYKFTLGYTDGKEDKVFYNGQEMDMANFRNLYQVIMNTTTFGEGAAPIADSPTLTLKFNLLNHTTDTITFTPNGDRTCLYKLNGEGTFNVYTTQVDTIMDSVTKFINNQTINNN